MENHEKSRKIIVTSVYTLRDVAAGEQLSFDYLWASAENPQCVADLRATALALYNSVRAHWAVGFEAFMLVRTHPWLRSTYVVPSCSEAASLCTRASALRCSPASGRFAASAISCSRFVF